MEKKSDPLIVRKMLDVFKHRLGQLAQCSARIGWVVCLGSAYECPDGLIFLCILLCNKKHMVI